MLLYFSATGNCKYVAQRLAAAYNEKAISILDCLHQEQYDFSESTIGIVFPTYFWGLPSLVQEFLEKASFQTDYLYFIATYGTTPGAAGHMAAQAIRGRSVDAFYSVRMPDTWTPLFDLSSPGKVAAFTKTTEAEIDTILRCVQSRHTNSHMSPRVPLLMAKCFAQPFYHSKARRTTHFHVEQSYIGNCLLLNDEALHVCPRAVADILLCRYFRRVILVEDPLLEKSLLNPKDIRQCAIYGSAFIGKSNHAKYCPDYAATVHRKQKADYARKKRSSVYN